MYKYFKFLMNELLNSGIILQQIPTGGGWLNCYYCNVYTSGGQSTGGGWGGYYPWNPGFGHPSQSQGNTLQNRCPVGQDYSQKLGRCVQIWGGIPPGTG